MSDDVEAAVPAVPAAFPAPAARSTRRGNLLGLTSTTPLLVLAGLAAAQGFDSGAFGVLAPEIRHSFHLDNAGIDSVAALTGALPLLGSVFIGHLGDKGDRIRITRYSGILWGVTAVCTGIAPVLAILVVARLLGGIGLLSSNTIYPSLLSDFYEENQRAKVFTTYLLASTGLGLAASPLAGWMGDTFGWRWTFVALALPTFAFVAMLSFLREPGRRSTPGNEPAPHASSWRSMRESFRAIKSVKTLRRTWWGAFILGGAAAPLATLVSTFYKDVYHVDSFGRGAIISAVGVGGLLGLLASGAVAQRTVAGGRAWMLPVVSGVSAVVFGVLVAVASGVPMLWLDVLLTGLAGVALGGFLPPYTTLVSLAIPAHLRSQAYAWSTMFFALGAILVAAFVGSLADAAGQRPALLSLGLVIVLGGAVIVTARTFARSDLVAAPEEVPPTGWSG